jgi:hypothetical protein
VDHHLFDDKNTTITSFSWLSSQGLPTLAVTSNSLNDAGKGATTLVRFTNDQHLEVSAISKDGLIPIHEGYGLPVPVYSSCWSGCTLFTGGDDGSLRMVNTSHSIAFDAY